MTPAMSADPDAVLEKYRAAAPGEKPAVFAELLGRLRALLAEAL